MLDAPVLSVVIPAYDRAEPLRLTLRTVEAAAQHIPTEVIVVDDGSKTPLASQFSEFRHVTWLRQPNQGSIVARNTGLLAANGEFLLFLDSDDLVHPRKFVEQVERMKGTGADVSYSDMAIYDLNAAGEPVFRLGRRLPAVESLSELFLRVQLAPHNPIYRRSYLLRNLTTPLIPAFRAYDPAGDIWLYYNLLLDHGRPVKIDQPFTAIGVHTVDRYSSHWERLGFAALDIVEAFVARCPRTPVTAQLRATVGETAFNSWRRLPYDFDERYQHRLLSIWKTSPPSRLDRLGGPKFRALARIIGPVRAGWWLRRLNGKPYSASRTMSDDQFRALIAVNAGP